MFALNRALLILSVAATLGGLLLGHWDLVRIKAILL
jgi:hypothetical protein